MFVNLNAKEPGVRKGKLQEKILFYLRFLFPASAFAFSIIINLCCGIYREITTSETIKSLAGSRRSGSDISHLIYAAYVVILTEQTNKLKILIS